MTRRGLLLLLTCAATAAAGYLFAAEELWMLAAAWLAAYFCSGLSLFLAWLFLRAAPYTEKTPVAHRTEAAVVLRIRGKCPLPVTVRWKARFPFTDQVCVVERPCRIFRRSQETVQPFFCPHIGTFSPKLKAEIRDVFGLLRLPLRGDYATCVTVWPKARAVVLPLSFSELTREEASMGNPEDRGDTFTDARRYREGDSPKRIHWKLSLRNREWYTRRYEREKQSPILLWVDTPLPSEDADDYRDAVCEAAASIGTELLHRGMPVRLFAAGNEPTRTLQGGEEALLYDALSALHWSPDDRNAAEPSCAYVTVIGGCRPHFGAWVWERFGERGTGVTVCPDVSEEETTPCLPLQWPRELVR